MIKKNILKAGAAKADITPKPGTQLGGDIGRFRPVEEIRDRLFARAIVVRSESDTICVVTCDADCINHAEALELRRKIAGILGSGTEDVLIHCSQSHSSPRIGAFLDDVRGLIPPELAWLRGDTPPYREFFSGQVLNAVKEAAGKLVPVKGRFARCIDSRSIFNRRFVMRNGSACTHPALCDENILHCEGPVDPEASLLLFEDSQAHPVAGLLHYTCHPIHGYPMRYVSADWPGLWSEYLSEKLGNGCVVGCLNGACGNVSPTDHTNPAYARSSSLDSMMNALRQTGDLLLGKLKEIQIWPLRKAAETLRIPQLPVPDETIAKAAELLEKNPAPPFIDDTKERVPWEWVLAVRDLDRVESMKKNPCYDLELQVFRLGEVLLVGWPGEPFVEAQLEVKLKARAKAVLAGHECNSGDCGYLPTERAIRSGGYEVSIGRRTESGALETLVQRTLKAIDGISD